MKSMRENERPDASGKSDKYYIPVVARAIDLLDCFSSSAECLTLEQAVRRTGVPHTTTYRILHTLVQLNYLTQSGREYRLNRSRKRLKFGFANLSRTVAVAREIQESLESAAQSAGVDLLIWDNNRDAKQAIRNAMEMVEEKVDLAIEFQLLENVAPIISDIFSKAEIPMVSVVNPQHGTVYFGVHNYRAGFTAGLALADFAAQRWSSHADEIVLLESTLAGKTVQSRLVGALRGIEDKLGKLPEKFIHHLEGGGDQERSEEALANFLKRKMHKNILVVAINDESAIGAVRAVRRVGNHLEIAIVGHGGSAEILEVVAARESPCIGTVAFHTARYGPEFFGFALPIVTGKSAPVAHYVPHEFISKFTVAAGSQLRTLTRAF